MVAAGTSNGPNNTIMKFVVCINLDIDFLGNGEGQRENQILFF